MVADLSLVKERQLEVLDVADPPRAAGVGEVQILRMQARSR